MIQPAQPRINEWRLSAAVAVDNNATSRQGAAPSSHSFFNRKIVRSVHQRLPRKACLQSKRNCLSGMQPLQDHLAASNAAAISQFDGHIARASEGVVVNGW